VGRCVAANTTCEIGHRSNADFHNEVTSPVRLVLAGIHLLRTAVRQVGAEHSRESRHGIAAGGQQHLLDAHGVAGGNRDARVHDGDAAPTGMGKLAEWCDEASVVHWNQETADLPKWHEAHRRMVAEGRPSRVRHPSPAHQALRIPPPQIPIGN
jgi:hypothetical protein